MDDQGYVKLANDMLTRLHVPVRVKRMSDIGADVVVTLYEGLCGESLPDVIRNPKSKEDEIHNCQSVIDCLAMDVLHTSLSHISGQDVAMGDKTAIGNLLEVFSGLLEYILNRIDSDISSDNEDEDIAGDPDQVTPEIIDDILERELGQGYRVRDPGVMTYSPPQRDPPTATVTRRADPGQPLSQPVAHSSLQKSDQPGDTTADLIREGEEMERLLRERQNQIPKLSRTAPEQIPAMDTRTVKPTSTAGAGTLKGSVTAVSSTSPKKYATTYPQRAQHELLKKQLQDASEAPERDMLRDDSPKQMEQDHSVDSSIVSPPKPISAEQQGQNQTDMKEFGSIGVRPRPAEYEPGRDPLARSMDTALQQRQAAAQPVQHTFTHHLYHHYGDSRPSRGTHPLSASMPITSMATRPSRTEPPIKTRYLSAPDQPGIRRDAPPAKPGKSQSFENLDHLMSDTVAMSRAAVKGSPVKRDVPVSKELSDALKTLQEESMTLDSLLSARSVSPEATDRERQSKEQSDSKEQFPRSPKRKVSFLVDRSSDGKSDESDRSRYQERSKEQPRLYGQDFGRARSGTDDPLRENLRKYLTSRMERETSKPATRARADIENQPPMAKSDQVGTRTKITQSRRDREEAGPSRDYRQYDRREERPYLAVNRQERDERLQRYEEEDDVSEDEDEDVIQHSDTEVDYRDGIDDLDLRLDDLSDYHMPPTKHVRFKDLLAPSGTGASRSFRGELDREERLARAKTKLLGKQLKQDLIETRDEKHYELGRVKGKAKKKESEYKKGVLLGPQLYKPKVERRVVERRERLSRSATIGKGRKRSASSSPTVGRKRGPLTIGEDDLLPMMLEEFPFIHLSSETIHALWKKGYRQLEQFTKAAQEVKRKKSKVQVQLEEAQKRQDILMDIMRKEMAHNQRMRDIQDRKAQQLSLQSKTREKRLQSARARRYYDDYQVRMRSKMLKKRTREEMLFKKLFKEGLDIQKERIRELRNYAKEHRTNRTKKQQNELESLENFYRDRFAMLAESMAREKTEVAVREKAQSKVLSQMKRELRKKMEKEIQEFQEQMYRDEDDAYFRQLDADRLKHELEMARYQARIL